MKQSATIENEMMMYLKSLTTDNRSNVRIALPGKQVIRNIMNYSRSLQVLRKKDGEPIFLIGN